MTTEIRYYVVVTSPIGVPIILGSWLEENKTKAFEFANKVNERLDHLERPGSMRGPYGRAYVCDVDYPKWSRAWRWAMGTEDA